MKRLVSWSVAGAFAVLCSSVAQAAVLRVFPGLSIQSAIDSAQPGDTILVEPGDYMESGNGLYGLRIETDNLRLIGIERNGEGVRLIANEDQETGILAAPSGCDYLDNAEECAEKRGESEITFIQGFYIRGFSVEEFPVNGIQTRWVDGFEFVRNKSVNNLNNGLYPTLSANGLVSENESYGSLDTAMWIAGSENVRVIGNTLHDSVIGFEITVSNNVTVERNLIHNNNVGVGLFHPDGAGNPPLETMANWRIFDNNIAFNNGGAVAPEGSFQSLVPTGSGVLVLGVSDHEVIGNTVANNGYVGIGVVGWCSGLVGTGRDCTGPEEDPLRPRDASNNLVARNFLKNNGVRAQAPLLDLTQDIAYLHIGELEDVNPLFENFSLIEPPGTGNCFQDNYTYPGGIISYFSSFLFDTETGNGELPTDGC
ncbi:MAG: right-handed parallel beta-helix repeat-containing protein [Pseudomonadota bacterium]